MATPGMTSQYMTQLLDQLGWDKGTRIPLANPVNQALEDLLIKRHAEIQKLKEALILQKQKQTDLNKYKGSVYTEYEENSRLLLAHKQQMEQEVKLKQLSTNESERLSRDVISCNKQSKDIGTRIDRIQANIARQLKKAEGLKTEVIGERDALQDWRAALDRSENDITAIEQFTKQDLSKARELDNQRKKLKNEMDKLQDKLNTLMSNLSAEERSCERISNQVTEGMAQRKQMMSMWTGAVENLRQRDIEIRHIKEDYAVLEDECSKIADECRDQQKFCDEQHVNNIEATKENQGITQELGRMRVGYARLVEENVTLDSESRSLQRELCNLRIGLEKLRMENNHIMEEQRRKDAAIRKLVAKLESLKEKLAESLDQTATSEKRAKELESMLNQEEQYANMLTANQQRAMHCSFMESQKLLALQNEEKIIRMQLQSAKAIMNKLDNKQATIEKQLHSQKETLYNMCYQVETVGAKVAYMETLQGERYNSADLLEKETRLKGVCARHTARVVTLERHSAKLHDDMRRLAKELEKVQAEHTRLQSRLRTSLLEVEGCEKELKGVRELCRKDRVEEALMRLRVEQAHKAVASLGDKAFSIDKQRLQLDAAMNERMIEINARRDMFSVQRRSLFESVGQLRSEIKEREGRIEQLVKRYDILIASLGKDDAGQQLSVTYFKVKFASERAELRERGASLDADIDKATKEVTAMEHTLTLIRHTHSHFMHMISPLSQDTPEIEELNQLTDTYYELKSESKQLSAILTELEQKVNNLNEKLTLLEDKSKQLTAREIDAENDLFEARERVSRNLTRLDNAHESVNHTSRRTRKIIPPGEDWYYFQLGLYIRDYSEAAYNALRSLAEISQSGGEELTLKMSQVIKKADIEKLVTKNQKKLLVFIKKILLEPEQPSTKVRTDSSGSDLFSPSVSSVRSGVSIASGYTRRLTGLRKTLATKIQEPTLVEEIPEKARRSTVSLKVITLGLGECGKTFPVNED